MEKLNWEHMKDTVCPMWTAKTPNRHWIIADTERGKYLLHCYTLDNPYSQLHKEEHESFIEAKARAGRLAEKEVAA